MEKILKSRYLIFLFGIVFLLDVIGCWRYYSDPTFVGIYTWKQLFASLYLTLKLFTMSITVNESIVPLSINILRFISPLLLASVILNYFFLKTRIYWTYITVSLFKEHIIFCGLSDSSFMLINDYLEINKTNRIVVIEHDENIISNYPFNMQRVKLINGNALDDTILMKSKILRARTVFALSENESYNISVANKIQNLYLKYPRKNKNLLNVIIHLTDFYNLRIFKNFQEKTIPNLDFHAFNIYQKAAAFIVDKYSPDLFIDIREEDDFSTKILVHGLDVSGENVIIESAHLYHFCNLKKTQITVVDSNIIHKKQLFIKKYPYIEDVVEIEFFEEDEFFRSLYKTQKKIAVCFICDCNVAESILIARRYRQLFFEYYFDRKEVFKGKVETDNLLLTEPIIVINLSVTLNILNLFGNISMMAQNLNIKIESAFENVCSKKILSDDFQAIDDIAKQFHNTYLKLDSRELEKSWDDLTDENKDFNRYPARHIAIKLRYLGAELADLRIERPDFDFDKISSKQKLTLARMEHERWCAEKLLTGFIHGRDVFEKDFYKLVKENLKWHKDLQSWDKLSNEDKYKDEMLNELKSITRKLKHKKIIYRMIN